MPSKSGRQAFANMSNSLQIEMKISATLNSVGDFGLGLPLTILVEHGLSQILVSLGLRRAPLATNVRYCPSGH